MSNIIVTSVDDLSLITQLDSDPLIKHITATCHYEITNDNGDVLIGSIRKLWDSEYPAEIEDMNDMIAVCRSGAEEFLQEKFGDL